MKVLVTAAVLLIMFARVNSVPLELGVHSKSYLEVREQLEERREEPEENQHQREARSVSDNADNSTTSMDKAVRHGSTVAFQQYAVDWLGCSKTSTSSTISKCPGWYMRGNDWRSCSQAVFQIFHAKGPGDVQVDDLVGLYYKREGGNWFGCSGTLCAKNTCPSISCNEYGFDTPEEWYHCYGQVFKIYAHEKQLGDTVNDQDDIMLFYL